MKFIHLFRNLLPLVSIMLLISCTGQSEDKHTNASDSNADSISEMVPAGDSAFKKQAMPSNNSANGNTEAKIKSQYAEIMHLKNQKRLDSTTFQYSCNGEKNGRVTYFSDKGKLKMIAHSYNEYDHFSSEDQYFVEDGKAYFVYQRSVAWSFESGPEGSTKDNITERRLYLSNSEPLKCMEKKFTTRSQSADNPRSEQIANKIVNCTWADDAEKEFKLLAKYYGQPAPTCLSQR